MSSLKDANVKCPGCGYIAGVYIDPDKTIVRCLSCRHDARSEAWLKAYTSAVIAPDRSKP